MLISVVYTNVEFGEERTNATNNRALMIEMRFKKKKGCMRGFQEISLTPNQDRSGKFATHKKGMSTVRCVCGFEILVVPDLKAMNRAIKNHLAEHKRALDLLEWFLTEQILTVASKMNLPNVS